MTHTKQWVEVPHPDGEGTIRVRLPVAKPKPRGRMIWNSDMNGTYIRAKDPQIGYTKRKKSLRKLSARLLRSKEPRG